MRVLGFSDEVTVCDCCGKRNLSGTFAVESGAGVVLNYGSVCVNRVYGRRKGEAIKAAARRIREVRTLEWSKVVDRYSRGHYCDVFGVMEDGRKCWNNSNEQMRRIVRFDTAEGVVVRRIEVA